MELLLKAKEKVNNIGKKWIRLIQALGGQIKGEAPLQNADAVKIRRRAGQLVFLVFAGFLFASASAPFESYPFAIALVCAVGHQSALAVFIGAFAGALTVKGFALTHLLIYLLALVCRALLSPHSDIEGRRIFDESPKLRILICSACAFLMGICTFVLTIDDRGISGIMSLVFTVVASSSLCTLFSLGENKGEQFEALKDASGAAVLFCVIFCLSVSPVFGLSIARTLSFMIILAIAKSQGVIKSALTGLISSIALGTSPLPLVLAGFSAGAFRVFGTLPAVFIAMGVTLGSHIYLDGFVSLFAVGADIIFATLLYIPIEKTGIIEKLVPQKNENLEKTDNALIKESEIQCEKKRFAALSLAFEELSEVFMKLSSNLRNPGIYELRNLSEDVFDRYCKKCSLIAFCRQSRYEEYLEGVDLISQTLRKKGYVPREETPEFLMKRCRHIDKIIADINKECAASVEAAIKKDKTELFALDYEAISELLREGSELDGEFESDPELSAKLSKLLRSMGISFLACGAWGMRKKTLLASGVDMGSITLTADEIKRALEKGTELTLSTPKFDFSGEFVSMTLSSSHAYKMISKSEGCTASGEEVSGDRGVTFEGVDSYSYACICDGMGSGKGAAAVSEISALFFEKMLGAGNCIPVTLKLLSCFLRARSEEYHCTADIFRLDRISGKGCFIKCGAPPSYVIRKGNIFKIEARSMPLGLTREINAEKIEMELIEGDTVVMVSDGVAPDLEEAVWLPELLGECSALEISTIADCVARRAKAENGASDDITVTVLRVVKD